MDNQKTSTDQPMQQEPMGQQPVQQQSMGQQPMNQQPMGQQPMYQQPMYQQPMYQQPMYQQAVGQQNFTPPQPESHLGLAIFTTICCCLPFGIVAIFKGNKVGDLYALKQYDAAIAASNEAKRWCVYGIVSWFIIDFILLIIYLIGGAAALSFLPWSDYLG